MNELFVYLIFAVNGILGTTDVAIPVSYVIIITVAILGLVLMTILVVVIRRHGYRHYLSQVKLDKSPEPQDTYVYSTVEKPTRHDTKERIGDDTNQGSETSQQDAYVYSTVQKSVKKRSCDVAGFSISDTTSGVPPVPSSDVTSPDAGTDASLQQRSSAGNYDSAFFSNDQILPHPDYDHVTSNNQSQTSSSDNKCATFSVASGAQSSTGYEMVELA